MPLSDTPYYYLLSRAAVTQFIAVTHRPEMHDYATRFVGIYSCQVIHLPSACSYAAIFFGDSDAFIEGSLGGWNEGRKDG